jgi:di/tricarboxylate transporter
MEIGFLIAGMLPMGIAMENTGTAQLIADWIVILIGDLGLLAVLAGIYIMTGLLTEVMSNAAATVLVAPIAIDAALRLDANPQTFVIGVVLAASTSFLMPIGHQVNVIIFGPGGYKFSDYTRVGVILNVVLLLVVLLTLPLVWPLRP